MNVEFKVSEGVVDFDYELLKAYPYDIEHLGDNDWQCEEYWLDYFGTLKEVIEDIMDYENRNEYNFLKNKKEQIGLTLIELERLENLENLVL